MSKMIELVDEMRARLKQITDAEQTLVRAMGDALQLVDERLLQDVRNIRTDHEVRRGAILQELQGLASRIGAFPVAPGLEREATPRSITATKANRDPIAHGSNGGDWRHNITDDLDRYFRKRPSH
jgi:hypothetical protein